MFVTFAIGMCSLAPAETLVTVPVTAAARRSGMTRPLAPAASAVRRIAPEIVRILDAIEHDYQRILRALGGDDIGQIVVLLGRRDGHDSLVRAGARHLVEFRALQETHLNVQPPTVFNQPLQADVMALLGHADPFKGPPARLQRFGYRIDAIDVVHEYSVYRVATLADVILRRAQRSEGPQQRGIDNALETTLAACISVYSPLHGTAESTEGPSRRLRRRSR